MKYLCEWKWYRVVMAISADFLIHRRGRLMRSALLDEALTYKNCSIIHSTRCVVRSNWNIPLQHSFHTSTANYIKIYCEWCETIHTMAACLVYLYAAYVPECSTWCHDIYIVVFLWPKSSMALLNNTYTVIYNVHIFHKQSRTLHLY